MLFRPWVIGLAIAWLGGILVSISSNAYPAQSSDKLTVGWAEEILILPDNIVVRAKIDTGADHSSLHVKNTTEFTRSDTPWVRFEIESKTGKNHTLERPIQRFAQVKRKGTVSQKRPVVLFDLCLGPIMKKSIEVNLTDRSGFVFSMLIGRSFLGGAAVVDPEQAYTQTVPCSLE